MIFHIIGPDLKPIMADMPSNVYYWGAETYHKLPSWLSAMDVGLYISKGGSSTYTSPLKVFDYMASGLTVVSTSHPAVSDIFKELGQSDLMVPSEDAQALANILLNLSQNRDRVSRQGQAGRNLIIDRYNWRRSAQDTMIEIEALLRDRKK